MDIQQIRQAALNSLYAHKDHLDTLRRKSVDDEVQVVDVRPKTQAPSVQPLAGVQIPPTTLPTSLPTQTMSSLPTLPTPPPLARQKPSPYPRQHAPPPPVVSKPTFLGLLGGHPVYQSIFDLRRLGLRFDEILQQSGCSEEFLRHVFKQLGYSIESVVSKPAPAPVQPQTVPNTASPRTQPVLTFEQFRKTRSELNTPTPRTPPVTSAGTFAPHTAAAPPTRSIPRFGEKSRRQKRLCIEISDSESDSDGDGVVSKKHKDMSLEETRLEIARIQALIAQQSASSRNGTPSHEDSEVSEVGEVGGAVVNGNGVEVKVESTDSPVVAAVPTTQASPTPSLPPITPEVQAYLTSKNIALESLSAVQLDKIVQIVKLKTLLQGEEDAFLSATKKIPPTDIPLSAPRHPNQSDTEGGDSRGPLLHSPQPQTQTQQSNQQDQPALVRRETADSSYRSPLAAFRSHKFGPLSSLERPKPHVDSESSDSQADAGSDTISLAEFKPSELPLCPYELQGVCNDSKCEQYAHWRDLRLSKNERILEIMRAFVGVSPEEQKQYRTELNVRLKQLKGADFDTILPALTQFRNQHISDGHFLDWYAFNRVDVQN